MTCPNEIQSVPVKTEAETQVDEKRQPVPTGLEGETVEAYAEREEKRSELEEIWLKTKVPWLVPACSTSELQEKIEEAGEDLFDVIPIAGRVPGVSSDNLDASTVPWDSSKEELSWWFEIKARSQTFSMVEGCATLHTKMTEMAQAQGDGSIYKKHAVLVGVTDSQHSRSMYGKRVNGFESF